MPTPRFAKWMLILGLTAIGAVNLALNPEFIPMSYAQTGGCDPETAPCNCQGAEAECVNGEWVCPEGS